ncbi:MAG: aldehyde dehydrogenase family protein [Betaproteobacteria bacterium]|jgi:aldehyde dehydrogenase (NAD+)|nr:aldehyde dehydrogenase family protein [Betaproteobacteria bacterium]
MSAALISTTTSLLANLGVVIPANTGSGIVARSPIDGSTLAVLQPDTHAEVSAKIAAAQTAFLTWRNVPAPKRGELVRLFGEELRANKDALGQLVTIESGKILQEGLGEVQEMVDICDFAVGLSRQLYGLTIATERPKHRMMEQWHPLGVVGIISAFNFPVAVWAWNAALALVCGNSLVWKPSEKTPLTALACQALLARAMARFTAAGGVVPAGLSQVLTGNADVGEVLVDDSRVALVSATGSTRMGRSVAARVANRLGRSLLELGGNNAAIVTPSANMDLVLPASLFSAVGTAGQRCTTLRRAIVHTSLADQLVTRLKVAYQRVRIGNPLDAKTLIGPLIDRAAFDGMQAALSAAKEQGGIVSGGERALAAEFGGELENGYYAHPAIVEMPSQTTCVHHETFAPILYVMRYETLEEAINMQNAVPQGLSSSIFTNDMREAEIFMSASGSDCGIANVNIGTSGAEIGGAFGGEKDTGGGRESGSDSWRAYMRRATNTINYSADLPLAQSIVFNLES